MSTNHRRNNENVPLLALEWTMLNMRTDMYQDMIAPPVHLVASSDVAPELRNWVPICGIAASEHLEELPVQLAPGV